jgi:signal transduction histidine kinase
MVAHELRSPLSAITNALYILENMQLPDARAERQLTTANRQTRQLARLVEDLMDISRLGRGKIELRCEPVALGRVVGEAAEAMRPLIEARGQEFTRHLPPENLLVNADAGRLDQILTNLLGNAVKYTEPGGRIWLTVEREGTEAVIRVRDTGVGIDPPLLPQIFDMFHQIEASEARSQGGLGIGLALVKHLVEAHGGTVTARSAGEGHGTEFVVRLPLRAPAGA